MKKVSGRYLNFPYAHPNLKNTFYIFPVVIGKVGSVTNVDGVQLVDFFSFLPLG
jgi:hypothetical protein